MKKLAIFLALLALPLAYSHGQLSVSGVAGSGGYSVLRARLDTGLMLIPGLSMNLNYALFEQDGMSSMSRFGAGADYKLPFLDIASVGVGATYQPKANDYSNYSYDIHGSVNLAELTFHVLPTDELRLGGGYSRTFHSFYNPDNDVHQDDIYGFITQKTGGFDTSFIYRKAIRYVGDKNETPPWLDIPNFVSVYAGFLDYAWGVSAGYTYKGIRPYAAYTSLKTTESPSTDDLRLGITLAVFMVDLNASVEWLNFTQNSDNRKTLFALSGSVKFL